jgi:ankyrin repeat protein
LGRNLFVTQLLAAKANLNTVDNDGWTPLMRAAGEGHGPIVNLLLSAGADKTVKNRDGETARDIAHEHHHYPIVRTLDGVCR